jgi:hypothetical protein
MPNEAKVLRKFYEHFRTTRVRPQRLSHLWFRHLFASRELPEHLTL